MTDDIKAMKLSDMPPTLPFRMVEFYPVGWSHGHNYFGDRTESLETIAEGLVPGTADEGCPLSDVGRTATGDGANAA
jgi:hypothetical protein